MKKIIAILVFSLSLKVFSQRVENVIIITLDGMRWQEVFSGADSILINDSNFVHNRKGLKEMFWAVSADERRKKLFPFFWSTIASQGQLYGNRWLGNKVNNANRYWFSYPGYNEIFTGYPDDSVNSNDKILNKNINVLEFLNKQPALNGKVAAFTSWDTFDAIFNEPRAKFLVSSGFDTLKIKDPAFDLLNEMQFNSPQPLGDGVRPDFMTYSIAKEYVKKIKPRILYMGFDETDDYAHEGKYDQYLYAAHLIDQWIGDLWNYIQSQPQYKNKTALIITTDHGRGDKIKKEWTSHGTKISDASEIWMAVLGPGIKSLGEVNTEAQLYQKQIATTIASLLGYNFTPEHPVTEPVKSVIGK